MISRFKYIIFLILFSGFSTQAIAQSFEKLKIFKEFVDYYNKEKPDSIYKLFNIPMQEALPIEKTREFIGQTKTQLGDIISYEFIAYHEQNTKLAIYKTKFRNAEFDVFIEVNNKLISGLLLKPHKDKSIKIMERNITKMELPFNGKWYVVWGGDTKELNYHVESDSQKNAFDFVIIGDNGKSYSNSGNKNEDYHCFGKNLLAPCDAEVFMAVDGIKDNIPGKMDTSFPMGNTVILKTDAGEYIYLCHFKQFSIRVKEGSKVKKGDVLGNCGNSGRSSEPHLHFHIQNTYDAMNATGIKCYFNNIVVNGLNKQDYSPVQAEMVGQ